MTEFPSLRRLNVSYTLVHVVYWAMFAIFAGYQTSLLLGRGFTSGCLLYTSPSPRDMRRSRMPSSA